MSWKAMAHVIEMTEGLTHIEKSILFDLAYYHNDETHRCDPSITRLCKMDLLHERTVQRALRSLAKKKLIKIHERNGRSSQYDLLCITSGADVTPVTKSPLSEKHPTSGADATQTLEQQVSSSEELRSSSSSPDEEEDRKNFLDLVVARYRPGFFTRDHPGLRSPIKAPGPYFKKLRENGDAPAWFGVVNVIEACQLVRDALVMDFPEGHQKRKERFTVPMPAVIGGMMEVLQTIKLHTSSRAQIRRATLSFVRYDDESLEPEIEPEHLLGRIARHPEKFVTALENAARES